MAPLWLSVLQEVSLSMHTLSKDPVPHIKAMPAPVPDVGVRAKGPE